MSRARVRAALCLAAAALVLGAGLGACGKRGGPRPPEGEESRYTYPRTYPHPRSVLPSEEEGETVPGESPAHAGDISTFPKPRSRTTYGTEAPQ